MAVPGGLDLHSLRTIPLFQGLEDRALRALLTDASLKRAEDGTVLFIQGDEADRFYVLLDGWVKLYRVTDDGAQAIVTVVAPGETFAEAAMFASARFPVCAEAVGEALTLVLTKRAFTAALTADPQIALAMLAAFSLRLRHMVETIEQLQVRSTPQRLADFLVRHCGTSSGPASVDLPFSKVLVAQRLGMRPETLSRALASLRARGVVVAGNRVTIADVGRLRAFRDAPNRTSAVGATDPGDCGHGKNDHDGTDPLDQAKRLAEENGCCANTEDGDQREGERRDIYGDVPQRRQIEPECQGVLDNTGDSRKPEDL